MANNINMGISDPLGLQTPEQQVRAFFLAQIYRDLQQFKEAVVYYGFHYEVEAAKVEEQWEFWKAQLEVTEHVLLTGINTLVVLTPELKKAIIKEAQDTKATYFKCCKYPELAQFIDNSVQIKLAAEP